MESDSDQVRRIMERNEQPHEEAEETLDQINKKTGRNMPQAIATGAALVILIVACLLLSVDLFVLLVVVFMILALWELRVDFATVGLHLPVFMLWLCSSFTLIATYYSPYHLITMSLSIIVSIILVAIAASAKISVGNRLSLAVAANCPTRMPARASNPRLIMRAGNSIIPGSAMWLCPCLPCCIFRCWPAASSSH